MASQRRLDAFDQWCIQHILRIPYTAHVSNFEVRSRAGRPPITTCIRQRRLKLFGHVARADIAEDHNRALQAYLSTHLVGLTGDGREDALIRPGYELSVMILSISTLAYIQFIVEHIIVLHGKSSWKQLCSPDDDDDDD